MLIFKKAFGVVNPPKEHFPPPTTCREFSLEYTEPRKVVGKYLSYVIFSGCSFEIQIMCVISVKRRFRRDLPKKRMNRIRGLKIFIA